MRAITYHAPGDLRVERVPDPVLRHPTDAIVAVRLTAICGSDLHVWHGRELGLDAGSPSSSPTSCRSNRDREPITPLSGRPTAA